MKAKIFKCGNSLALRLPKKLQFQVGEVEIFQRGEETILREKPSNLSRAFELLTSMPSDFFTSGRVDTPPQERESF